MAATITDTKKAWKTLLPLNTLIHQFSRTLKSAQISTKFHPMLSRMMRAEKKRTVSSTQHHDNIAETKDTTREGRS